MQEPKSTVKMHIVGEQVAAARKLLRMTQVELAEATGLTKQTIIKFERGGNVRPETVEALRNALLDRGIEFTNGGRPGVNLNRQPAAWQRS
ncbi:MAG: helix-turn-helix transcriptional regulator [Myxococcales bacterium]|nr:helix-turn-helix transcriptional regulator [Myxococcales bacterium]